MADIDPFGGLAGSDRDAYAAILNTLQAFNLEGLAPTVLGFLQEGYSQDTISVLLPETPEYKQRFAGNEARKRAGLPVLSPAEYLSVENAYRDILSANGLPRGFYDSPEDFRKWIEADVSPTEVQSRVDVAKSLVYSADPESLDSFSEWYTAGDMIAYALDTAVAAPLLEKQYLAAVAGGSATRNNGQLTQDQAEEVAGSGASELQIRQGVGASVEVARVGRTLGAIHGIDYGLDDALDEAFGQSAVAETKRKKLASAERAAFGGGSAATFGSLQSRRPGTV